MSDCVIGRIHVGPDYCVTGLDAEICRHVSGADDVYVVCGGACGPFPRGTPQRSGGSDVAGHRAVPRVLVPEVGYAIIVVVKVEVVLEAVAVEVARPLELVNATVVVIVLVVRVRPDSISVLIGDSVVVVVHRVLVDAITDAHWGTCPRMNRIWVHVSICADVPRVGPLRVVDRSL